MITTFTFILATLFIVAYGYYPQDNLYYMAASLSIAAFITAICELVIWWHNTRVAKENEEYQRRINDIVIGKSPRYESKGTSFPTRGK